jgi:lipopolysaccharide/colanic/teichoic acid biosynthesis glycosyltransferase
MREGGPVLTRGDRVLKRSFDVAASLAGLAALGWLIALAWLVASIDTGRSGFFRQTRVGRWGRPFKTIKIRTMREVPGVSTVVTTSRDPRITRVGRFLRRTKIDELPQLWNVLVGQMSFVGPRPDVPGFADTLDGDDRVILSVRPGITGPATLRFRNEEELLSGRPDPEAYNREVIYREKVRLNRRYIERYRFADDIKYILQTIWRP